VIKLTVKKRSYLLKAFFKCRKRGATATKENAKWAVVTNRRRNGTNRVGQMLDGNYCESGRVTCEESARVVRYYSPPANSLQVYSLLTFFRDSFHFSCHLEFEICGIFVNKTYASIFLVKSEKHSLIFYGTDQFRL